MAHGCTLAVGPLVPAGVHAVGGQAHRVRHLDVGRREPEQPAPLVAAHDRAADLVRPPEHAGGQLDLAAGEGPADGRAADRLVDRRRPARRGAPGRRRSRGRAPSSRAGATLPSRWLPKWKSSPTTTTLDGEAVDEHPLDERLGRLLRLRLVEVQHDGGVEPGGGEQLEALLGDGQQLRRRLRAARPSPGGGRTSARPTGRRARRRARRTSAMTAWWPRWTPS